MSSTHQLIRFAVRNETIGSRQQSVYKRDPLSALSAVLSLTLNGEFAIFSETSGGDHYETIFSGYEENAI